MIAKTAPSFDPPVLTPSGAAPQAGDAKGVSPFDQLMASLSSGPAAGPSSVPGQAAPVPMAAPAVAPPVSFVPARPAPQIQPEGDAVAADADAPVEAPAATDAPVQATPVPTAPVPAAPDAAALALAGVPVPVPGASIPAAPIPSAPAKPNEAAPPTALLAGAAVPQRADFRPAKPIKAPLAGEARPVDAAAPAIEAETTILRELAPVADQAAAAIKSDPILQVQPHKPATDALPMPSAPADVTGSALASQSLETRLDVARDALWIDRAARDIAQLANGEGRLRFRLDPDHLGALQIDMANGADGLSMRVTTETEAARTILADAQPRLIAEARAQGVRIAEAHVDLGSHSGGEGRNAPPPPPMVARDQAFESDAAETTAPLSGERFA